MTLYRRSWSLTITQPGAQSVPAVYGSTDITPSELRVVFEVERTLGSSKANKAKIAITNLAPDNRNNIVAGTMVVLRAGYYQNADIIFRGYVAKIESKQDGPDTTTELECEDGGPQLTYGNVHLSYKEPVDLSYVLQDIAAQLDVTLGGVAYPIGGVLVQGVPKYQFKKLVQSGPVKRVLHHVLKPFSMTWSIQSGVLLLQNNKGAINLTAEVLSPETGLIGVPSRTPTGVNCTALINPRLSPGSALVIASSNQGVNGNFRAIKCTYKGDTEGNDWTVDIEGQPLAAPLAPVPVSQDKGDFSSAEDAGDEGYAEVEE